jgi:D-Tyr-tRNAtyr deacylase
MKAIVQRVRHAKVVGEKLTNSFLYHSLTMDLNISLVDNQEVSSIGPGICVLLGISKDDTRQDLDWMYEFCCIKN